MKAIVIADASALVALQGQPVIQYVLKQLDILPPGDVVVVTPPDGEALRGAAGAGYQFAENRYPGEGSAGAVASARPLLGEVDEPVLVCFANRPLLTRATYQGVLSRSQATKAACTWLVAKATPTPPYGRLIWNAKGILTDVVEEADCSQEERALDEVFAGVAVFDGKGLWGWMDEVLADDTGRAREITGAVRMVVVQGLRQVLVPLSDTKQLLAVQTLEDANVAAEYIG